MLATSALFDPPLDNPSTPVIPVVKGNPVQFVRVPEVGVPNIGVMKVGEVLNTKEPVPVSSVTDAAKLALVGVAKKVAIPAAKPLMPVLIGKPMQLVKVPDVGVPKIGLTIVGVFANTFAPVPVSSVRAAAKFALVGELRNVAILAANPLTPVEIGNPVAFVKIIAVGVPKAGVMRVGLVWPTNKPVPVWPESPLFTALFVAI